MRMIVQASPARTRGRRLRRPPVAGAAVPVRVPVPRPVPLPRHVPRHVPRHRRPPHPDRRRRHQPAPEGHHRHRGAPGHQRHVHGGRHHHPRPGRHRHLLLHPELRHRPPVRQQRPVQDLHQLRLHAGPHRQERDARLRL